MIQRAHFFHNAVKERPTWTWKRWFATVNSIKMERIQCASEHVRYGRGGCRINSGTHAAHRSKAWSALEQLHHEKEVIGFYLSGHPLDDHRLEIKHLCNTTLPDLKELDKVEGRELCFSGIVTRAEHRIGKSGKQFGILERRGSFRHTRLHALQRGLHEVQALHATRCTYS
jgi:DNA polymerase III alpha subunit